MKNILITGAAGYLGKIVLADLVTQQRAGALPACTLVALDVRATPPEQQLAGVQYGQLDIRSPQLVELFRRHGITTVVHLAAILVPRDRALAEAVEIGGLQNVLHACLATGVEKIIVTSSGAAYGYHADNPPLLTEQHPLRGNDEIPYARHKRLIEELLARHRREHPELQQVIFRVSTILGETTHNPITAYFEMPWLLAVKGSDSPFVFIWDQDAAACIRQAIFTDKTGIYNLAGDGTLTLAELAHMLGRKTLTLPAGLLRWGLALLHKLRLTPYGPAQLDFLRYRPVLDNTKLKREFGYTPVLTSREVFARYAKARFQR
ncbi:MAG: SDR family oxidoreductase [candidate division KSB1 bacterium]|nr:SDR family oxidoreductase [candidate division KSB1 bacterium]MDZ7273588.1 SDR family oxidoreductase [candidate division KSB1 bacterium]MDZ7286821.1 SDR family oxidoreductase [candidate division KSB1 bacterium]MDZ7299822.1 SDR family oxidoreductase [candidate division KSB1 bacterium]MDZ7308453.1 SDR family oxidoreductase [candidate division KSB1 bacterium]